MKVIVHQFDISGPTDIIDVDLNALIPPAYELIKDSETLQIQHGRLYIMCKIKEKKKVKDMPTPIVVRRNNDDMRF